MSGCERQIADIRTAFSGRLKPVEWLRSDLRPVDQIDGQDLVDSAKSGGDVREFFCSAIPYFLFLTSDAAFYLLPDLLETISQDRSHVMNVYLALNNDHGRAVLSGLTAPERGAVLELFETLRASSDFPPETEVLTDLIAML